MSLRLRHLMLRKNCSPFWIRACSHPLNSRSPGPALNIARTAEPSAQQAYQVAGLGDYVGGELILEKRQTVPQKELALLKPLNLQPVSGAYMKQRLDRGIEIPMLLNSDVQVPPVAKRGPRRSVFPP